MKRRRRTRAEKQRRIVPQISPIKADEPLISDVPLIKKDLLKTLIISIFLTVLLIGIYIYLG
ncbi:MAG: hypothetical protein COU65_03975 [Candidatus Pacebacteria bacterium CG10_big_fil_rev_8_21_14_0_10_42_12]|nr:hypothetical protein [Candidatus Paceibacterota bacterium]PIR62330.1 MAG: hypothetical protein COU65_03975 [Candidatus Pacebacteria bacterium CG10_big_fil_rev_8_21_14_0_10_42_12]